MLTDPGAANIGITIIFIRFLIQLKYISYKLAEAVLCCRTTTRRGCQNTLKYSFGASEYFRTPIAPEASLLNLAAFFSLKDTLAKDSPYTDVYLEGVIVIAVFSADHLLVRLLPSGKRG